MEKSTVKGLIFVVFFIVLTSGFYVNAFALNVVEPEPVYPPTVSELAPAYLGDQLLPSVSINFSDMDNPNNTSSALQLLFLVTVLSLAPTLLLVMTSFTRIIIVLHFIRSAMGTQQMPPNQIIIGLALVITFFLMTPVLTDINENAFQPYMRGEISQGQAIEEGMEPIREFMMRQVRTDDIGMFASLTQETFEPDNPPNHILIPAFVLGEVTAGFLTGFGIYLPFIVIDMVVASVLMAMGMMMLPPAMISLPFKILMFLMAGGWSRYIHAIITSFR